MADLASILTALAMSSGLHAYGHQAAGNEVNVPVSINWRNRTESWDTPDARKDAQTTAGGFAAQDKLASALMGTDAESSARIANALYKLGYFSGLTLPKGPQGQQIEGDIDALERLSGNKATKPLLALSSLADLYLAKNPKSRWSSQFIAPEGAPGAAITYRW